VIKRKAIISGIIFILSLAVLQSEERSLFTKKIASSDMTQAAFAYIESNREKIIDEWITLTEIPAPSGHEEKRAEYLLKRFKEIGLEGARIDDAGNVLGVWQGSTEGKNVVLAAHMDTVFQGVWEIEVKREGNVLKAPGIGDDTASLINTLWVIQALQHAGYKPKNTYTFLMTVGEETGFEGMEKFMNSTKTKFDCVVALDGDLGSVHYGALGFGGGRITFRGPGAHTMQSRGIPNPNIAVGRAVERLYKIKLFDDPIEKWTILNVGMIGGGKVRNAVSQESYFTIDLRSADQGELERVQKEIKEICLSVANELDVEVEIRLNDRSRAYQVPGARESYLVKTVMDILDYLEVNGARADPLGSTDANVGIERGILSINLGRTYGRFKHSLREEADIDGLFLAQKQILLLLFCLN
jgi:acetylornithine deacetylase/succinyl-diaminopimelate desuccinylase-like protein